MSFIKDILTFYKYAIILCLLEFVSLARLIFLTFNFYLYKVLYII